MRDYAIKTLQPSFSQTLSPIFDTNILCNEVCMNRVLGWGRSIEAANQPKIYREPTPGPKQKPKYAIESISLKQPVELVIRGKERIHHRFQRW